MKATGIVSRIDDLGRVVIPKEIRRTMRIREGDPLEIYTSRDGEVIFKKYSLLGGLEDFAADLCETMSRSTGAICAVTDRDTVIAVAGGARRELMGKRISPELERIMEARKIYQSTGEGPAVPVSEDSDKLRACVAAPILAEGDLLGLVLFVGDGDTVTGETSELPVTAMFVAIGHDPRSQMVAGQIDLDESGYVKVDSPSTRTSLPGVFAAGDLVDSHYQQAISAAGTGCTAAIDAEHYLAALG